MNVFTVAGRPTKDSEQRFTASGAAVLGFTVATDVGFGDKKHSIFVNCSLWGKRGESLAPYIKKGTSMTVSGELDLRKWEKDGKNGATLELNVSEVALQGGRQETASEPKAEGFRQSSPQQQTTTPQEFADDDIPF